MISDQGKAYLRELVKAGSTLIFGPVGGERSHGEWAAWHSGVEFLTPAWERDCLLLLSRGFSKQGLADILDVPLWQVTEAVGRQARTLATYERNACKWSTRYVAVEPQACANDGASERDQRRERTNRRGSV